MNTSFKAIWSGVARCISLSTLRIAAWICLAFAPMALADGDQNAAYPDTDQLGKRWWQLVMSIPGPQNPFLDRTGASCGIGQNGGIWFLYSSSVGPRVDLRCTIPAGTTIFMAVVAAICVPYPGETIYQQFRFCREAIDTVDLLSLTIDGRARDGLIERRASAKPFALPTSDENVFGFAPGVFAAVHDGFYATIPPLAPGYHTVRVRGAVSSEDFSVDTLYRLHIVKPSSVLPFAP